MKNLETFFNPKSVAVIGASNSREKLGWQIFDNIRSNGFRGEVYPINLKEKEIGGLRAYPNIKDLSGRVDLAVLVIPAPFVLAEILNCADAGVKNLIIITAGFSEDSPEGKEKEEQIKKIAAERGLNILGPNCLGLINTGVNLNATFARAKNKKGKVAFVSQSGAICSAVLDWAEGEPVGFSKFVSLGNKAVLSENDFFEYFLKDEETDLVVAYLEEIKKGEEFTAAASRLAAKKPVIVLKAGKSQAGQKAAMSHTGSLAGSNEALIAGLKRAGVISVDNLEEMFDLILFYQKKFKMQNRDLFIISNAGGPLVITVDSASAVGLKMAELKPSVAAELKAKLPPIVKIKNPLDIIGDARADRFRFALEAIARDRDSSNILVILTPQSSTEVEETARVVAQISASYPDKIICASFIGGDSLSPVKKIMAESGVVVFDFPNEAIDVLAKLVAYEKDKEILRPYVPLGNSRRDVGKGEQMDFMKALALFKKYGLPAVKTVKVSGPADFKKMKYPLAMKVTGKNLVHKTDSRALALNIKDKKEAIRALKDFSRLLKDKDNYCLAQPMVKGGAEMILGFRRDESFGPIIMVGLGGIYTEIFKDVGREMSDVDEKRALAMIKGLKAYAILAGARGQEALDASALAAAVVKVARIAREHPEIKELDVNPLFVNKRGVLAADARIIL